MCSFFISYRLENRTSKTISICQSGFDDDHSIHLTPLSTTNFSWDDPYGHKTLNVSVYTDNSVNISTISLETAVICSVEGTGVQFQLVHTGNITVARFTEEQPSSLSAHGDAQVMHESGESLQVQRKVRNIAPLFEFTVELGVLGLSVIDHRPRELSYLYLERVYIAYATGCDGGTTNRYGYFNAFIYTLAFFILSVIRTRANKYGSRNTGFHLLFFFFW